MEQRTGMSMRAEQRQALLPSMLQSIEVLQMATLDLLSHIDLELSQNETLDLLTPEPADDRTEEEPVSDPFQYGDPDEGPERRSKPSEDQDHYNQIQNVAAPAASLMEHLRDQLLWRQDLTPEQMEAVLVLAGMLDRRGLLPLDDVTLAADLAGVLPAEVIPEARRILGSLDPLGLGAIDAVSAMMLQVDPDDPDRPLLQTLLTTHLVPLSRHRHLEVAAALGLSKTELEELLARMKGLDPHPGARFSEQSAPALKPELVARWIDGSVDVRADGRELPQLTIDDHYAAMARDRSMTTEVRSYLRGKLDSARTLISAIEHRQETLLRVGRAVMVRQVAFLEQGRARIAPLKMSEIATELGMHTSTISRAIAGKSVQTDFGTFPLREFFDGGRLVQQTGSQSAPATGRAGIKQQIRMLVLAEDTARPLSDDDLVALMKARAIQVARRTVTKYRKELGIPSTWERRRAGS